MSVRFFLARHLLFENVVKRIAKVHHRGKRNPEAASDPSHGSIFTILGDGREGQANMVPVESALGENINRQRLNLLTVDNVESLIAQFERRHLFAPSIGLGLQTLPALGPPVESEAA